MKRICITFDDGRKDNIDYAVPILNRYNLKATFFITTGYVDGSFVPQTWLSSEGPMSVENITFLDTDGHEVALHGDRHCTDPKDFSTCVKKMNAWLHCNRKYGFSLPGSKMTDYPVDIFKKEMQESLLYIRGGSHCNFNKTFFLKLRKALCLYSKLNFFFTAYHKDDVFKQKIDIIPSIGVRVNDTPSQLISLINTMENDDCMIIMFHSILPEKSPHYGRDKWCWSEVKFEELCAFLHSEILNNRAEVQLMKNL